MGFLVVSLADDAFLPRLGPASSPVWRPPLFFALSYSHSPIRGSPEAGRRPLHAPYQSPGIEPSDGPSPKKRYMATTILVGYFWRYGSPWAKVGATKKALGSEPWTYPRVVIEKGAHSNSGDTLKTKRQDGHHAEARLLSQMLNGVCLIRVQTRWRIAFLHWNGIVRPAVPKAGQWFKLGL